MSYVGAAGAPSSGCVFCAALAAPDDRKHLVLHRAADAFLILNAYPYAPGHLMAGKSQNARNKDPPYLPRVDLSRARNP